MGFVLESINLFLDSHTQINGVYTKRFQPFVILLTLEFKLCIFSANTCTSQYFSFSGLFFVCESDLSLLRLVFDKRASLLASAIDPAESVNTPGCWLTDPASTISKKLDRRCTVPKHESCRHTQNIALQRQGSVKPIQRYMRLQRGSACKRYQVTARQIKFVRMGFMVQLSNYVCTPHTILNASSR